MSILRTSLALAAILSLAACSDSPFGGGAADRSANAGAGVVSSDASDPTSVAYFETAVGDRVLFAVDQATLGSEAIATLNAQAQWLRTNGAYTITIEGHADEQGTREYNLALGDRRAQAVRDHLVAQGIAGNRINTVTYGKERPLEICSTEACWSQNRRGVTVVDTGLTG